MRRNIPVFARSCRIPGVATSVETFRPDAIRGIREATRKRSLELGARLKLAVDGILPNWSSELMDVLENAFPEATNLDAPAVQGRDIHGQVADFTNRIIPARARA